jgi:hypothetical protein
MLLTLLIAAQGRPCGLIKVVVEFIFQRNQCLSPEVCPEPDKRYV